jgi:hypothetical protein
MTSKPLELQREREEQREGCSAAERSFWLNEPLPEWENQLEGGVPGSSNKPSNTRNSSVSLATRTWSG